MLAKELHSSNFDHRVLFSNNVTLELYVVFGVPFSRGCNEILVFHFNELAHNLQANEMQLLRELPLIKHLKESADDGCESQILKRGLFMACASFHDVFDS